MTPNQPTQQSTPPQNEKEDFTQSAKKLSDKFRLQNKSTWIYLLLVLGLFLLLFAPPFGGLLIGAIVGYTFSDEILTYVLQLKEAIEDTEVSRGVVLGVLCLVFLITSPFVILGAAIAVALKKIMVLTEKKEP